MKRLSLLACALVVGVVAACTPNDPSQLITAPRRAGARSGAPKTSAPATDKADAGAADAGRVKTSPSDAGALPNDAATDAASSAPTDAATTAADAATAREAGAGARDPGSYDPFDSFQRHNLDVINQFRAQAGAPPLVLDARMTTFATLSSQDVSGAHQAHALFLTAQGDGTLAGTYGFSGAAQTQGDAEGWPALSTNPTDSETRQIDAILESMYDEGPGGANHDILVNPAITRLGVGLVEVEGELYFTNDFSE